jgi:hypothetical protein
MNQTVKQHKRIVKANSHIGAKYPCAVSKEDVERLEVKRIGRVFGTACFIAYLVILGTFFLMFLV